MSSVKIIMTLIFQTMFAASLSTLSLCTMDDAMAQYRELDESEKTLLYYKTE